MRLTCPSCGAQYEVPPEAIPPSGRDVQCSACQHTWFEKDAPPAPLSDEELFASLPRSDNDEEEGDDLAEAASSPPPAPRPGRPTVTPEVAGILRSEAEREAKARAQEGRAQEVGAARPALAITDRPPATSALADAPRRPSDRLREPEPLEPPTPLPDPPRRSARPAPSRRAERPLDIDQINSTLRSTSDRIGGKGPRIGEPQRRRRGFGGGFTGALLAAALLAALYVFAPRIMAAVPGSAAVLQPYVQAVDSGRLWLEERIGDALNGEAPAPAE